MDFMYRSLTADVVARNIELVAALCVLPPSEACDTLATLGKEIQMPDGTGPKISVDDFRAIRDAFGLVPLYDVQKPL